MEDKETVIQRVINFLYDALDRFRDTMSDLNQNVSSLMDSLKKGCTKHQKRIRDLDYPNEEHNCEDYDEKELTK